MSVLHLLIHNGRSFM